MSERKVVDYILCSASETYELREKVLFELSKGYTLYGNPISVVGNCCDVTYCQAMVKYED